MLLVKWQFLRSSTLCLRSLPWTNSLCLEISLRSWTAPWGRGTGRAHRRTPSPDISPPERLTPWSGSPSPGEKNNNTHLTVDHQVKNKKHNMKSVEFKTAQDKNPTGDQNIFKVTQKSSLQSIYFVPLDCFAHWNAGESMWSCSVITCSLHCNFLCHSLFSIFISGMDNFLPTSLHNFHMSLEQGVH